jgi:hypothetical protein
VPRNAAAFLNLAAFSRLPLWAKIRYLLLRPTKSGFGGLAMKHLALVLAACGVVALAFATEARAFDIQGQNASPQDGVQPFASPVDPTLSPDFSRGSSLALPYISKTDSSAFISDYGNMIAIPSPGIDKPTPAWAAR